MFTYLFLGAFFGLVFIFGFGQMIEDAGHKRVLRDSMSQEQYDSHLNTVKAIIALSITFLWIPIIVGILVKVVADAWRGEKQ